MPLGIDPKVDYAFKKLFGSQENKHLLIAFLKAILKEEIVDVELLNPFSDKDSLDEKLSILDIKAKFADGRFLIVEMQMVVVASYPQPILFYWSKTYHQQLSVGEDYRKLVGVIAIHILNGVVSQESEEYHSIFELRERKNPKVVLTPQLQIHLLELPKFHLAAEAIQDNLERWSYFLKHAEALEPRQLPVNLQTDDISQAVEVLQIMNQDDRERMLYEARQKAWRDAETNRVEAFDRGIDRGRLVQMYEQLEWFLNLKFSSSGTALMPVVRRVESLDSLLQIRDWIQAANSIEELTRKLVVE